MTMKFRLHALKIVLLCVGVSSTWECAALLSVQHDKPRILSASIPRRGGKLHLSSQAEDADLMSGVKEFNNWFSSLSGAECSPSIEHSTFGTSLRGLSCSQEAGELAGKELMTIPRSIVLQSDFSDADWDVRLAEKLWEECKLGSRSSVAGYTALLTKGWTPNDLPEIPPSTAPDALRHWSPEQLKVLSGSANGQRLLDLKQQQEVLWRGKFDKTTGMTWEQFEWSMEAVSSRAFCGDFGIGSSPISPVASAAAPALAAVAGYLYYVQFHGQNDAVLLGLGIVAVLPAILNLLNQSPPAAVLLPLIDSANHLESADSIIEYSPLRDSFTLSAGANCFVPDDSKQQFYISYGQKKDTELLLNYGFLNGVTLDGDEDQRRNTLASAFISK